MMMKQFIRKRNRLPDYDYSSNGAYFVTVCTQNKVHCLSRIQWSDIDAVVRLSWQGEIVKRFIDAIPVKYPMVSVEQFVVMPNHVHLLLRFEREARTEEMSDAGKKGTGDPSPTEHRAPTLGTILGWWKYQTTKEINRIRGGNAALWQRSYYDHVIRDAADYATRWKYIEGNPYRWADDPYCMEGEEAVCL